MADYAEATADFDLSDRALRQAYPDRSVYLPAVQPTLAPVVHQPVLLPERGSRFDVPSQRLAATGFCAIGVGGGVYLGGLGIHQAGPYLPWLAGSLAALAALVTAVKSKGGAPSGGTTVTISGNKNRVGRIG